MPTTVPRFHLLTHCPTTVIIKYSQYTLGKKFLQTSFQVGMDLKEVQKQGRDETMQEDYSTSLNIQQM